MFGQLGADAKNNKNVLPAEKRGIRIVYDKLSDRSEAVSDWFAVKGKQEFPGMTAPLNFAANFRFSGQNLKSSSNEFGLLFSYSARSWMFTLHHNLLFLVDGESVDFGDGSYTTKPSGAGKTSGVSESLRFVANREQLEKIAHGRQVEFQLGAFAAALPEQSKIMLREVLNLSAGK